MSYSAGCNYSENPPIFGCTFSHDNAKVTAWKSDVPGDGKRRHIEYDDGQGLYTYSWPDSFDPDSYTVQCITNVVHEKLQVSRNASPSIPLLLGLFTAIEVLGHAVRKGDSYDIQTFHIDYSLKQVLEITKAVKPLLKPESHT